MQICRVGSTIGPTGQRGCRWQPLGGWRGSGGSTASRVDVPTSRIETPSRGTAVSNDCVYGCCGSATSATRRPGLHQPPQVHHRQVVAHVAHGRQVVRDEENRDSEPGAQIPQEIQDGALHGDVERRGDLVRDQNLGPNRQRARECHPLTLSAGETARQLARHGRIQVDELEQLLHLLRPDGARRAPPGAGGLGDRCTHGHPRVERGEWILEDHLHAAVQPGDVSGAPAPRRDAVEQDLSTRERDEPDDRPGESRLPRSGLADETDDRLLRHREVDALDRSECRLAAAEPDGQTTRLERGHASASSRMDSASRANPCSGVTEFGCQQATR